MITQYDRAIVTIAMGSDPSYRYGIASMERYANRVGAKVIVIREPFIPIKGLSDARHMAWLQKIYALQLVDQFESILYVDADVLITPTAPDIFQLMNRLNAECAIYDEGHLGRQHYVHQLQEVIGQPLPDDLFKVYFNAGVIYLSRGSQIGRELEAEDVRAVMKGGVSCPEQTWLNYLIHLKGQGVTLLERKYNFMEERNDDLESRLDAYFIHYAGYSFRASKRQKRVDVMRADYFRLFENKGVFAIIKCFNFSIADKVLGLCWSLDKKLSRLKAR